MIIIESTSTQVGFFKMYTSISIDVKMPKKNAQKSAAKRMTKQQELVNSNHLEALAN